MSAFFRRWPSGLVVAALLLTTAPNWIYLSLAPGRGYWLAQCVTGVLLAILPLLLNWTFRRSLLIMLPLALFAPFAAGYAWSTALPPSLYSLQILREATREELFTFLPQLIGCAAISLGLGVGFGLLIWRCGPRKLGMPRWLRWIGLALALAAVGKDLARSGAVQGGKILRSRLEQMAPTCPFALAVHYCQQGWLIPDRRAVLTTYAVRAAAATPAQGVCVLIIGESARRDALGLYHPGRGTTPRLEARNLVLFQDALSCGTSTIQAVPILVTGRFPDAGQMLPYRHLGVVEAFRLAGFHTAWLSTQAADGESDSFISAFSVNADEKHFFNGRLQQSEPKFVAPKCDEVMLPPLERILQARSGRLLIVLHTLGSHAPYLKRYPAEAEKWPIDAAAKAAMGRWFPPYDAAQRRQLEKAYFNAINYTDWFCDQVIAAVARQGRPAAVIYLSDHGENTAAAPLMPAGHAVLTDDVVKIPFWIWLSPEMKRARGEAALALTANAAKAVSAEDLFSTACGLFALQTGEEDPAKDLAAETYREHARRIMLLYGQIVTLPPGVDGVANGR